MGQHHALGFAFRTRGEEYGCRAVRRLPCGHQAWCVGTDRRCSLGPHGQRFANVFEVDQLAFAAKFCLDIFKLAQFDKTMRGDNAFYVRHANGCTKILQTGREIQHCRHTAIGRQREYRDHHANARRQQHANRFAAPGTLFQRIAKRKSGAHQLLVTQRTFVAIDQNFPFGPESVRRFEQRRQQRAPCARGVKRRQRILQCKSLV